MTYAAIDATTATDRSIPPVSMVSVWHAAMMARGIANRSVLDTQLGVTMPGCTICRTRTSTASRTNSATSGRSRIHARATATIDWSRAVATPAVMPSSAAASR